MLIIVFDCFFTLYFPQLLESCSAPVTNQACSFNEGQGARPAAISQPLGLKDLVKDLQNSVSALVQDTIAKSSAPSEFTEVIENYIHPSITSSFPSHHDLVELQAHLRTTQVEQNRK